MSTSHSKLEILAAVVGAMILLPLLALAQPSPEKAAEHCDMPMPPPGHHAMPGDKFMDGKFMDGPMPPFLHGLDLSESQRDAIFKITYAQMPLMRDKMKSLHKSEEALHALTLSNQYDDAKAKTLAETIADDMALMSLMRAQSEHQIYTLLTPEQRKQAEEMKAKFDFHHASDKDGKAQAKTRML